MYVGIDVFGRGCFGGGGYNSCKVWDLSCSHSLMIESHSEVYPIVSHGDCSLCARGSRRVSLQVSNLRLWSFFEAPPTGSCFHKHAFFNILKSTTEYL